VARPEYRAEALSIKPSACTIEPWILAFYSLLGCFEAAESRVNNAAYSADYVDVFTCYLM
jgi:hypothetical protein